LEDCKNLESEHSQTRDQKLEALNGWKAGVEALNFPNMRAEADAEALLQDLASMELSSKTQGASGTIHNDEFIQAKEIHEGQVEECRSKQVTFEEWWCQAQSQLTTGCDQYATCYETETGNFDTASTSIQNAADSRKAEFKSSKLILCYVQLLNMTDAHNQIDTCDTQEVDASRYEIAVPAKPDETDCKPLADEKTILADQPCTTTWKDAWYTGKTWHEHADAASHCIACSSSTVSDYPCPLPSPKVWDQVSKGGPNALPGAYTYFADAWEACATVEGCGFVLHGYLNKYYLRRLSDPDDIGSQYANKGMIFPANCKAQGVGIAT